MRARSRGVTAVVDCGVMPGLGGMLGLHLASRLDRAERLTILVCSIEREPIPGVLRFGWMRELFPNDRVLHICEELPQEPSAHPRFWSIWREAIARNVSEPIDYVFASEPYGHRLAAKGISTLLEVEKPSGKDWPP